MQRLSRKLKAEHKTIGFIPTMGFLHDGHISLVRKSKQKADITIVSIFVNPTQFAPNEDFEKYPRDAKRDKKLLSSNGVDYLFMPDVSEIYEPNYQTFVQVDKITGILEGEFRPLHFKGVATIVSILFNCVLPDYSFFGQKDAQQVAVIRQMTRDLKFDTDIVVCPIIREGDGLAMSSRNIYLSDQERIDALVLSKSLRLAVKLVKEGERQTSVIIFKMKREINLIASSKIDYVNIVDTDNFTIVDKLIFGGKYYILVACKIGKTRLIDNVIIKVS